ncbi:hypothetical protein PV326_012451 [Microctonus aethiopoides]|nr:hypothetical protein PV326_012451 [Microctonus aethiopoides]
MSDNQGVPTLPPLVGGGSNNGGNSSNTSGTQQTVNLQQVLATQGLNVLTTGAGQQFVITSQVPGLTQVIPSHTTTAGIQQIARIVNISSVASGSGSSIVTSSPNRQNTTTKVVLATSPKLVRTSLGNMFITPSSQASGSSPPVKKIKLMDMTDKATVIDDSVGYRRRIMEHKIKRMRAIRDKYAENASELFFLQHGGNMMDFQQWKKRSSTPSYVQFLRQHRLDPDDDNEDLSMPLPAITDIIATPTITTTTTTTAAAVTTSTTTQSVEVKITGVGVTPVAVSTTLPAAVAQLSQQGQIPGRPQGGRHGMVFAIRTAIQSPTVTVHPSPTSTIAPAIIIGGSTIVSDSIKPTMTLVANPVASKQISSTPLVTVAPTPASTSTKIPSLSISTPTSSAQPVVKLIKLPPSTTPISSDTQNNQEQIEAYVMQRITELQREGLWSERRLPKVQEPARTKAHWDYLLEEMVWLAADFAQERKWKKAAAKKCARMVQKHFQEKAIQAQKAEKLQELRLKKIAGFIAKEVKTFWSGVEKLVEFKQQTRLEEKRKKALDQHLNFIVGQTEKYSTWLTEGLNKTEGTQSIPASMNSSRISSPVPTTKPHSDDEFEPNQSSDDDEETIAKAEEEMKSITNHKEEVELLKKESEIPLEDLLKELPPNYLEERDKSLSPLMKEEPEDNIEEVNNTDGDAEFTVASNESSDDDEDTIMEQEESEKNTTDHRKELDDLKADNEMSIEELMAKYGGNASENTQMDVDDDTDHESEKDEDEECDDKSESESEVEDETRDDEDDVDEDNEGSQTQSDNETGVGLESLLEDLGDKSPSKNNADASQSEAAHNEMDDVAALAESIQPKGNTLQTTSVVTNIPFLLKHCLREYQHIGLDWLVTMYDRKLNGILADEMGLGKTIQTIALLAHLACEKSNWGPHLIIVPTSVMLNWEMECKKWCPGFKILTYYGTQKERKQKRTGWTKPNAFHICITSYKLVIQDHQSFRRKKWKYLILDEAQNIKNFKSQRWQLLLNFQTQRRLLLTGTPLQNNLMELWSLMHFLMPNVLRPFLLRRLKIEVEKQLPKKYEHVIMCRLSKRQRYLYDDFMSRAKTKETLASGNLLSVINVLMQLRKVCNHPNLFEVRPTVSPFQMEAIEYVTASLTWSVLDYDPFKHVDLSFLNLQLTNVERNLTAFASHRIRCLKTPRKLIEEIDSQPLPPPRCPAGKIKINVRLSNQAKAPPITPQVSQSKLKTFTGILPTPRVGTSPLIKSLNNQTTPTQGVTLRVAGGQQLQGYSVQLVQHQGNVKAIPMGTIAHNSQTTSVTTSTTSPINAQRITVGNANIRDGLQRLTTQTVTVKPCDSLQRISVPGFAQLVQTSTGRHIILTSNQQNTNTVSFPVMTSSGQRLTVLSPKFSSMNKVVTGVVTTTTSTIGSRPVMRVPPLNVTTTAAIAQTVVGAQQQQLQQQQQQQSLRCGIVTRSTQKEVIKRLPKEAPKSEFFSSQLENDRRQRRQAKLRTLANINERRCAACPLYGEDLFTALRIDKPASGCQWHSGWLHCSNVNKPLRKRREYFSHTEALAQAIKSTEQIVEELKEAFERFVVYVPAVRAPMPRFHVSHPSPHKFGVYQRFHATLQRQLEPKISILHPVAGAMMTQFPDPRLIQYDCGKLQSLDRLLRTLKSGNHRVLIFTQMTRMLDVLEAFLNFHGHIYLRLDGTTRVDQRQMLMERFNGDKRIFCFILSTRSGGVGVNLTGADTVIFYDSDWNPTMDAQAQDRCHRIGQTRDVHIYRLVSEKTVEENILKKANQKRLLGDLAIEGGNFTTAYFKSSTIQDLFNVDQTENDASARMAEVLEQNKERERTLMKETSLSQPSEEKVAIGALENALAAVEEDLDVQAAKTAKAEAVADLAEFDENIPLDDADRDDTQISKAEQEVQNIVSQLTPVERYAMNFIEESDGAFTAAQLAAAERELEQQKKEWELDRLRALREEEERRMRMADDDEKPLTFSREDAQNQVNNTSNSKRLGSNKNRRKIVPSRRNTRSYSNKSCEMRESSESETETTSESESESQEDLVEDSHDEESSHTESQSQDDDDDEGVEGDESQNDSENGGRYSRRRGRYRKANYSKNHLDLNSPRTRSRGNVKINLWTLDVSPILPVVKRNTKNHHWRKQRRDEDGGEGHDDGCDDECLCPQSPNSRKSNVKNSDNEKIENSLCDSNVTNTDANLSNEINEIKSDDNKESIKNIANLENLLAGKMSELTNSMELSSCGDDDSDEHERYPAFSPRIKKHSQKSPSKSPEFESPQSKSKSDSLINKNNDGSNHKNDSIRRKRGKRSRNNHVKRLTQTFDGVFDESGVKLETESIVALSNAEKSTSPVHVTRSMHKLSSQFNKSVDIDHNEDTENLDVNVGSPNNNKLTASSSPTNEIESPLNVEYCIIDSKSETTKVKADGELPEDSSYQDQSLDSETGSVILRITRTRSGFKTNVSLKKRANRSSKSQNSSNALNSDLSESTDCETSEIRDEAFDSVDDDEKSLQLIENDEPIQTENNKNVDEQINDNDAIADTKLPDENLLSTSTETFVCPNQPAKFTPEQKRHLRRPDTPFPRIMTRLAKANSPYTESSASATHNNDNNLMNKKNIRRPRSPTVELRRLTRFSGAQLTENSSSDCSRDIDLDEMHPPPAIKTVGESVKIRRSRSSRSSSPPLPRVTRSTVNVPEVLVSSKSLSIEKTTKLRSKNNLDNGFLSPMNTNRSSRSNSSSKLSETRKSTDIGVPSVFTSDRKIRPDTPIPKKIRRGSRSGVDIKSNVYLPNRNNKSLGSLRSSSVIGGDSGKNESSLDTDSNGNAVVGSEDLLRRDNRDVSPIYPDVNEKPQRTAKVVAILTLDTHSRNNHCNKSPGTTMNLTRKINDNTTTKQDGTSCETNIDESTHDTKVRSRSSSKSNINSRVSLPNDTTMQTVDVISESENDNTASTKDTAKKLRRQAKRQRKLSRIKSSEVQLINILDTDDIHLGPIKKSLKLQSTTSSSEKFNNSQTS